MLDKLGDHNPRCDADTVNGCIRCAKGFISLVLTIKKQIPGLLYKFTILSLKRKILIVQSIFRNMIKVVQRKICFLCVQMGDVS